MAFGNVLAVELDDDVTKLDSRFGRRAFLSDFGDQCSLHRIARQSNRCRQRCSDILDAHAKPAAYHSTVLAQLIDYFLCQVDRNGETDADVAARLAENRAVNADHFAVRIDQRSAAVAGID